MKAQALLHSQTHRYCMCMTKICTTISSIGNVALFGPQITDLLSVLDNLKRLHYVIFTLLVLNCAEIKTKLVPLALHVHGMLLEYQDENIM